MITIEKLQNWVKEINKDYQINQEAHISYLNAQELEAHDESRMVTLYINFKPYPYNNLPEEEQDDRYNEFQEHLQGFFTALARAAHNDILSDDTIDTMDVVRTDNEDNHFHLNIYQTYTYRNPVYCGTYNQILTDESIIITYVGFAL